MNRFLIVVWNRKKFSILKKKSMKAYRDTLWGITNLPSSTLEQQWEPRREWRSRGGDNDQTNWSPWCEQSVHLWSSFTYSYYSHYLLVSFCTSLTRWTDEVYVPLFPKLCFVGKPAFKGLYHHPPILQILLPLPGPEYRYSCCLVTATHSATRIRICVTFYS